MYVPIPRIDKVCSSIAFVPVEGTMTKAEFFMRTYCLAMLLLPVEYYSDVAVEYLRFLYQHEDFNEPQIKTEIDSFLDLQECGTSTLAKNFGELYYGFE